MPQGYELLRESTAMVRLAGCRVVEVRGRDRLEWLQGQVTQDLRDLLPGAARQACFCSATGQIEDIATVGALHDRLVVVTTRPQVLLRRVQQMVIMEDVTARALPGLLETVQGPRAAEALAHPASAFEFDLEGVHILGIANDRCRLGGWDVLIDDSQEQFTLAGGLSTASVAALDVAGLEAGIPTVGVDTTEMTLPPELGPEFVAATVSTTKGCYIGQEVLARIRSRGHTNWRWMGLRLSAPVQPGAEVSTPERPSAGFVTRAGHSPRLGPIAAAMLRREVAVEGSAVNVLGEVAKVVALPF